MADVSNIDQAFVGNWRGVQPQSSHMATPGSRAGLRRGKFRDKTVYAHRTYLAH